MFCTGTNLTSHFHHLYMYLSAFILFYPGPESRMASIQDNYNPPPTDCLSGWRISGQPRREKTGLPRHKSHTHTILRPVVSPRYFILFSALPPLLPPLPAQLPPSPPRCLSSALPSCKPPSFGSFCLCLLFDSPLISCTMRRICIENLTL